MPDRHRWERSLSHLVEAEQRFREGNDPEVLQRCYAAFEALEGAPKQILAALPDPEKRGQLDHALHAAREFMHSGRHVSKAEQLEGLFAVDHRDAAFALGNEAMAELHQPTAPEAVMRGGQ